MATKVPTEVSLRDEEDSYVGHEAFATSRPATKRFYLQEQQIVKGQPIPWDQQDSTLLQSRKAELLVTVWLLIGLHKCALKFDPNLLVGVVWLLALTRCASNTRL